MIDVSMNGISFTTSSQVDSGGLVWLRIENQLQGTHLDRAVRVIRATQGIDGEWKIVARFNKRLTLAEVQTVSRLI